MKKVALVTASNGGIGKSIVKKLLKKGYIVYSNGTTIQMDKNKLINFIQADMTIDQEIKKVIDKIFNKEGRLDLVVANLGSGKSISGWDIDNSEYKRIFDINFFSSVILATYSIKYLKKTNGNIIFISSIAGCESIGAPIPYSAAKSALLSFSKNLAKEVGKLKIRVNCISPGNVMFKNSTWDEKIKKDKKFVKNYIKQNVPMNKFATPKDISKTVIFLEKNRFITGENIVVDGGQINKII